MGDPVHKVVVSHLVGDRRPHLAKQLLKGVAGRARGIPDLFSDGLRLIVYLYNSVPLLYGYFVIG